MDVESALDDQDTAVPVACYVLAAYREVVVVDLPAFQDGLERPSVLEVAVHRADEEHLDDSVGCDFEVDHAVRQDDFVVDGFEADLPDDFALEYQDVVVVDLGVLPGDHSCVHDGQVKEVNLDVDCDLVVEVDHPDPLYDSVVNLDVVVPQEGGRLVEFPVGHEGLASLAP